MRNVIFQDLAAMIIADPSRRDNFLFQIPVFLTAEFENYVCLMREHLLACLRDEEGRGQIDKCLRGLNCRFDTLETEYKNTKSEVVAAVVEQQRGERAPFLLHYRGFSISVFG
jgi:hypothetical protein